MKINSKIILMLLSIFVFACKSDDLSSPSQNPTGEKTENKDGSENLYLSLNIETIDKVMGSTKADGYEQGYDHESAIINGRVFIFEGENPTTSKCVSSGDIRQIYYPGFTNTEPVDVLDNLLYTKDFRDIELTNFKFDTSKKYYVLAVLNAKSDFIFPTVDPEGGQSFGEWSTTVQTSDMVTPSDETFDILNYGNVYITTKKNYLTMTNATGLSNPQIGVGEYNPLTLALIDNNDITPDKGRDLEIGTTVYVQRNVARVVVTPASTLNGAMKMVTVGDIDVQVNISNVALDVTNTKSFGVMNIEGLNWSKTYFHSGSGVSFDQVFWAKDPNYSTQTLSANSTEFWRASRVNTSVKVPMYCLENTMDYDCQLQGQTTRVVVRCQWAYAAKGEGGEYLSTAMKNGCDCVFWFDSATTDTPSENVDNPAYKVFYRVRNKDEILCRKHIKEKLFAKACEVLKTEETHLSLEWKELSNGGKYPLNEIVSLKCDGKEITVDDLDIIAGALDLSDSTADPVKVFDNCFVYYIMRIPHFQQIYYPDVTWNPGTEIKRRSRDNIWIADYNENHLGRYGIVRNNSYNITVEKISNLGEPGIPEITDDDTDDIPDDLYIGLEFKVQAWSHHDVTVTF